jgi:hypothetical protein
VKLTEEMQPDGKGVIATLDAIGIFNQAVYAMPPIIDKDALARV